MTTKLKICNFKKITDLERKKYQATTLDNF